MKSDKISELTTSRLSVYLRCLNLLASAGIKTISSQALADQFRLNSAQIRKDLAHFGEFGTRGAAAVHAFLKRGALLHAAPRARYTRGRFSPGKRFSDEVGENF